MYCQKCGAIVSLDDNFCRKCGCSLVFNDQSNEHLDDAVVNGYVKFGSYQNPESKEIKPIEWEVLYKVHRVNEIEILLFSKFILCDKEFNISDHPRVLWKHSSIRQWLNDDFYNNCFTSSEKQIIKLSHLISNPDLDENTMPPDGDETDDKIFLLSFSDIVTLHIKSLKEKKRLLEHNYVMFNFYSPAWWLRSSDPRIMAPHIVSISGQPYYESYSTSKYGVCPAMSVSIPILGEFTFNHFLNKVRQRDHFEFGSYCQDFSGTFKKPIEWLVLRKSDTDLLIISRFGIDVKPYHNFEGVSWEYSNLRYWLNHDFFNEAFSLTEQKLIKLSNIEQNEGSVPPTNDRVFCLNCYEAKLYFHDDHDRLCKPTDFALSKGVHVKYGFSKWRLRSTTDTQWGGACVSANGTLNDRGHHMKYDTDVIRPALRILLPS